LTVMGPLETTNSFLSPSISATSVIGLRATPTTDCFAAYSGGYVLYPDQQYGTAYGMAWRDTGRTYVSMVGMLTPQNPVWSAYTYGFIGYGPGGDGDYSFYKNTFMRWYTSGTSDSGLLLINAPKFVVSAGTITRAEGGISASTITATTITAATYSGIPVTKSITVPDPTSGENITMFYLDNAAQFDRVWTVVSGSNPSVSWQIMSSSTRSAAGFAITGDTTSGATSSGAGITTIISPAVTVNGGTWVWLKTTSTGGTVNEFHLTTRFRSNV